VPPRRLIRWKSFWLGILVLCFLTWSWVHSLQQSDGMLGTWGRLYAGVMIYHGAVTFDAGLESPAINHPPQVDVSSLSVPMAEHVFPPAWEPNLIGLGIAHWLLLLLFLLTWSAFLTWRWRRRRHLTKPSP
jgi:hypothetical protein